MPVQSKIATKALAHNSNVGPSPLKLAITYYYANRETPVIRLYSAKDGVPGKVARPGISIQRVATMHQIPSLALQRAIAVGGEIKTRSEAHASDMIFTIPEEAALEEWCLHMSFWGYPVRIDILRGMAAAVFEDRERRNMEDASDFFPRIQSPNKDHPFERRDFKGNYHGPDLSVIGKNWHKRFLQRHQKLKSIYSRALDNDRAMNNNPVILRDFFTILDKVIKEFKIGPHNIYNMDEKGFLIGLIQRSLRVIEKSDEKAAFLRQPGSRETVTVIEAVGIFAQDIPPIVIMKGEKHLYGWYHGKIPGHWTTAVSPNGWTDAYLGLQWLVRNFEPHTCPEDLSEYRLLIFDGHDSHITWEFIEFAEAHRIKCLCLPRHGTHLLQPLDVGIFSPYSTAYSKVIQILLQAKQLT